MLASVGYLFYILQEWLFVEQIYAASLMLPIAVNIITDEEATDERLKKTKK